MASSCHGSPEGPRSVKAECAWVCAATSRHWGGGESCSDKGHAPWRSPPALPVSRPSFCAQLTGRVSVSSHFCAVWNRCFSKQAFVVKCIWELLGETKVNSSLCSWL